MSFDYGASCNRRQVQLLILVAFAETCFWKVALGMCSKMLVCIASLVSKYYNGACLTKRRLNRDRLPSYLATNCWNTKTKEANRDRPIDDVACCTRVLLHYCRYRWVTNGRKSPRVVRSWRNQPFLAVPGRAFRIKERL